MLKIAVCDDEVVFLNKLCGIIAQYLEGRKVDYAIDVFASGKEFVSDSTDITKYNIVFLDVNMAEMDGIQTAKQFRLLCPKSFLVFVTAFIDYTLEGYKVEAIRYVLKDDHYFKENIFEALEVILLKMQHLSKFIEYEFNVGVRRLYPEEIIYVESNLHKLTFHVKKDKETIYSIYMKLDDVETALSDECMCRIHKSYLVNMRYAVSLERYQLKLYEKIQLPIAQKRFIEAKNCFSQVKGAI